MRMIAIVVAFMFAAVAFSVQASAQDFSTALAKTVSEIPEGADVASMGFANTALTSDYSTRNPGAVDATDYPRSKGCVAATYATINFKSGPDVNLYIVSGVVRLPVGTLQVSYSDGGSEKATIDDFGNTLKFDGFPSIDAQYGFKLGDNLLLSNDELYVGMGYAYSKSKLSSHQFVGTPATTFEFDVTSRSMTQTLETGILYRVAKKVSLGAMHLRSWDETDVSVDGFSETTSSHNDQLRLGASVKVTPLTMVSADYRHLYLPDGEYDDQFFAGVEQFLIKNAVAVYGGYADGGLTTGLGVYLPFGGINFAYMHRPFRQTEEFLGKAEAFMLSAYGTF